MLILNKYVYRPTYSILHMLLAVDQVEDIHTDYPNCCLADVLLITAVTSLHNHSSSLFHTDVARM